MGDCIHGEVSAGLERLVQRLISIVLTFVCGSHDQCRSIARYATPDPQYHAQAAKLLCLMQTTLSGTQFIYQGQEIGMLDMPSDWDYDDLRDPAAKSYLDDELMKGGPEARANAIIGTHKFGRDNGRTPVQWTAGKNAGFSDTDGKCWIGVNGNCKTINVETQQADPNSIWHCWKRQVKLRKQHRAVFMHGAFELLDRDNKKTFSYLKTAEDGTAALICLNFSDSVQPLHAPDEALRGRWLKFLAGNDRDPLHGNDDLSAWEGRVYLLQQPVELTDGINIFHPVSA